jgi:hypothetical protein
VRCKKRRVVRQSSYYQNPAAPIEDDIGPAEICHTLYARFMQLTYNNQLLATFVAEAEDPGVTCAWAKQVIAEMNRIFVVLRSHSVTDAGGD